MGKSRYKFSHQANGLYYWYNVKPIDSRTEMIVCPVKWFWGLGE